MNKILIIDDERSIRSVLSEILVFEGYQVLEAENGKEGLALLLNDSFDLVFCDVKMPVMDGIELLEALSKNQISVPMIMISGHGTIDTAVEAIRKGAFDFIEKPLDLNRILITLRNVKERNQLVEETVVLRKTLKRIKGNHMIGETAAIEKIRSLITKIGPSDVRVLITGANGSGKELVARGLHDQSLRSKMPFIEVNCAAIPGELIESELFGHEKGAFTSAIKEKKGKFELANGGTLFLDEIGDMSLNAQAKVLRALQENLIQRVGGEKDLKIDCRIIAATNKDLRKEIQEGRFREDLFHRLAIIPIHVPTLNERIEDIPLLASYFLTGICQNHGIADKSFDAGALEALKLIHWSGNIRELRNVIERLVILADQVITASDVDLYANVK